MVLSQVSESRPGASGVMRLTFQKKATLTPFDRRVCFAQISFHKSTRSESAALPGGGKTNCRREWD